VVLVKETAVIETEFTTFIGRCERTGGCSASPSRPARWLLARGASTSPGVGAVIAQASTNPRLGHLGLNLPRARGPAPRVLEEIAARTCSSSAGSPMPGRDWFTAGRTGADNSLGGIASTGTWSSRPTRS
jgi:hypothetical protein